MIELELIREQLRLDDEVISDQLLTVYRDAALRWIEGRTNRKLFSAGAALPADAPDNALVLEADIQLAALLLIGHWATNPSDTTEAKLASIPMGAAALIEGERWFFDG